jgi:formate hydrogenlyase subunit 6/NADH:ubiquinone oxidoreductase subunit I
LPVEPLARNIRNPADKSATSETPRGEEQVESIERSRLMLDMETCISCYACERICPSKAIEMEEVAVPAKGMVKMPAVGMDRCMLCGFCEEVCPTGCLTLTKGYGFEVYDKRSLIKMPEELRG